MKKMTKRIFAIIMAVAMMAAVTVTASAVTGQETTTLSITNVGENATVNFYKIMEPNIDPNGVFLGYNAVDGVDGSKFGPKASPSDGDVTAAANAVKGKTPAKTFTNVTGGTCSWTDATAGVYVAIITAGEGDMKVYNPILLVAGYDANNQITGGSVSTGETYAGNSAVAKSSEPSTPKTAETGNPDTSVDPSKQTGSVGDVVTYTVSPTMPVYPANATNKTVFMTDTMGNGLTFDYSTLTVTMGSATYKVYNGKLKTSADAEDSTSIGVATETTNGFNINFHYDMLTDAPVITYKAIINENAVVGSEGNKNTVKLIYTNNPTDGNTYDDNNINNPPSGDSYKEKKDEKKVYTYELAFEKIDSATNAPLAGAVFGIYKDQACTQLVDVVTTNDNGLAISNQVGQGTYYVKEISAPEGYSLNANVYSVPTTWATAKSTATSETTTTVYTATESEKMEGTSQVGWLKGTGTNATFYAMDEYTAETAAAAGDVYAAYIKTSETTTSTQVTETQNEGAGVATLNDAIPNTTTSELPSTGGIGTYVFTIAGVAIMAIAAGLLIVRRKKA